MTREISRQVVSILRLGLGITFVFGLLGTVEFGIAGEWEIAGFQASLPLLAVVVWTLLKLGRFSQAVLFVQIALLVFLLAFALIVDAPINGEPRTVHDYLLVIALFGYLNHQRESSRTQFVLICLELAAYVFLNSFSPALPFSHPMPSALHASAAWCNSILSVFLLFRGLFAMQKQQKQTDAFARELGSAIWNNQIELFYQPQVDQARKTIGAEALIRWKHPQRGYISPGEFLPAAERLGLMQKISSWVLVEACKTLAAWADEDLLRDISLAINVPADQFLLEDFHRLCLDTIAVHGVDPNRLKLELTESVVVSDVETVIARMTALRSSGIAISLDDFGTGYSSLSYLRRLPFDQLKVDRSFVQGAVENENGAALARAIVKIGLDLKLSVLSEGIETEEQLRFFADCGCVEFQGYLFGRPMPRDAFEAHVAGPRGLAGGAPAP